MLDLPDHAVFRFDKSPVKSLWEPGNVPANNVTPDKPLTRLAHELHEDDVDWPKTAPGQLDASDRLLQCDDPGIPQPYGALHSPKLILASPINLDLLVANLVSQTPNSVPRKWIPPPLKHQKWLPGFDNGARVVARPHGSNRHPMDPTRTRGRDHSQLDAATGDRHSRSVGFAAPSDCPSHHPNCASATHPRTTPGDMGYALVETSYIKAHSPQLKVDNMSSSEVANASASASSSIGLCSEPEPANSTTAATALYRLDHLPPSNGGDSTSTETTVSGDTLPNPVDAMPRLMSDFDSLQVQEDPGQDLGQTPISVCNSVNWKGEEANLGLVGRGLIGLDSVFLMTSVPEGFDWKAEEANLAPVGLESVFSLMTSVLEGFDWKEDEANLALVGLDSVFLLMTSVLEGFVEWHWRQPRLDSGWAQHAMISCG